LELLHAYARANGTQSAAAKALGISPAYLCDLLKGRRRPGMLLLRRIGLQQVDGYEVVSRSRFGEF
jgi:hypothetical protein